VSEIAKLFFLSARTSFVAWSFRCALAPLSHGRARQRYSTKLLPHFAMSDCCDQAAAGERMRIDVSLGRLQDCLCFDGLACSCRCRDTL